LIHWLYQQGQFHQHFSSLFCRFFKKFVIKLSISSLLYFLIFLYYTCVISFICCTVKTFMLNSNQPFLLPLPFTSPLFLRHHCTCTINQTAWVWSTYSCINISQKKPLRKGADDFDLLRSNVPQAHLFYLAYIKLLISATHFPYPSFCLSCLFVCLFPYKYVYQSISSSVIKLT